jgi:hypothetical protein
MAVAAALKVYKDQKTEQRAAALKDAKCHICGQPGHFVAACTFNTFTKQAGKPANNMLARGEESDDDEEEEEEEAYSLAFSHIRL